MSTDRWRHQGGARAFVRPPLARERIEDTRPRIPIGKRFWNLRDREGDEVGALFSTGAVRPMVTALKSRDAASSIEIEITP